MILRYDFEIWFWDMILRNDISGTSARYEDSFNKQNIKRKCEHKTKCCSEDENNFFFLWGMKSNQVYLDLQMVQLLIYKIEMKFLKMWFLRNEISQLMTHDLQINIHIINSWLGSASSFVYDMNVDLRVIRHSLWNFISQKPHFQK